MSSVRKRDQSEHRFTVQDKALDLYNYTSDILRNDKVFDRKFSEIINRIDMEAFEVYHCVRRANEDLDNRIQDEAKKRIRLESEAVEHCSTLKTLIMLSKKKFHLRANRVAYWNGLVNAAMDHIKKWQASEIKTYNERFGL